MMANTTGSSLRDSALSLTLCESALTFALQHLPPSAATSTNSSSTTPIQLIVKHFTSHHTKEFTERLKKYFKSVRWIKPESSRKMSREGFLVCGGLRSREDWPESAGGDGTPAQEGEGKREEESLYF